MSIAFALAILQCGSVLGSRVLDKERQHLVKSIEAEMPETPGTNSSFFVGSGAKTELSEPGIIFAGRRPPLA